MDHTDQAILHKRESYVGDPYIEFDHIDEVFWQDSRSYVIEPFIDLDHINKAIDEANAWGK